MLGRIQYFYARFYNYFQWLEKAVANLEKAARLSLAQPFPLIHTTLGQVRLLQGDWNQAMRDFDRALRLGRTEKDAFIHNIYRGLGQVYTRQGRYKEANEQFTKALDRMGQDPHVKVSFAELCLRQHNYKKALYYGKDAMERTIGGTLAARKTLLASAHLICARIHLSLESYEEALRNVSAISDESHTMNSPRDLSLACLLLTAFPEAMYEKGDDNIQIVIYLANNLAKRAGFEAEDAPLCQSALGAAAYLSGQYATAIDHLDRAMKTRKAWPQQVKVYYASEDARDLYLMAMARWKQASRLPDAEEERMQARKDYEEAERMHGELVEFSEYWDLREKIRDRARDILGIAD
jgi:tetratricopeptide (TPR) repeat protein